MYNYIRNVITKYVSYYFMKRINHFSIQNITNYFNISVTCNNGLFYDAPITDIKYIFNIHKILQTYYIYITLSQKSIEI